MRGFCAPRKRLQGGLPEAPSSDVFVWSTYDVSLIYSGCDGGRRRPRARRPRALAGGSSVGL